ncbi:WGR domain-containing protein, predicted DNA-binding domain in MolR [Sphingomonas gellani]|uniref:WGR domain-containing protein, predicted DNA-binding domain in MolR n=1 Tax=Sphingomonas gellani TaxID=1166340 RepID=A0A1H8HZ81_9SPHN|nr:WGR domain-containing protein [Sphingomonas gellani]SEN61750.1 WGR domain-containing protein, predicted DNA-binding domain in MolR [Sphingomonas gellani]
MDTLPFHPIELVAVDAARNIRRRWSVVAMRDLFGRVVVETGWGRIGTAGRSLVRSFPDEASAARYVAALLRVRGTAWRRIGVGYVPAG